jgi:hypothetical protein
VWVAVPAVIQEVSNVDHFCDPHHNSATFSTSDLKLRRYTNVV